MMATLWWAIEEEKTEIEPNRQDDMSDGLVVLSVTKVPRGHTQHDGVVAVALTGELSEYLPAHIPGH